MKCFSQIAEPRFTGNGFRLLRVMFCLLPGMSQIHGLDVTGFQPASGLVGDEIRISGTGLDVVKTISLNGISLPIVPVSPWELQFVVPDGISSGLFAFVTDGGTTYSQDVFIVDDGFLDLDGDYLPDSWERQFLGGVSTGGLEDIDGDGFTNEEEWVAGTNPARLDSGLWVTDVVWKVGGGMEISWPSIAGKIYAIQFRSSLTGGDWDTLSRHAGSDEIVTATLRDFLPEEDLGLGFFRIITPPPDTVSPREFKVRAFANPPGGGSFQGTGSYAPDTALELSARPSAGYLFQGWGMGLDRADNPLEFNVIGDIFLVANFLNIPPVSDEYRIATQAVPSLGGDVQGAGQYSAGKEASLMAVPFSGYQFHRWEGDLSGSQNPVQVTVDRTLVVTARFVQESYSVQSASLPVHGGTVNGAGSFVFDSDVTLEAVVAPNYSFTGWSGGASGTDNPLSLRILSDVLVTANFVLTQDGYLLQASSQDHRKGMVAGGGAYPVGSNVTLEAVPADGYSFVQWSGDEIGSANPLPVTVDGERSIRALFAPETFSVSITSEGSGSVAGGGVFLMGEEIALTASSPGQSRFVGWSGDIDSTELTLKINVEKSLVLKAAFEASGGQADMLLVPGGKFTMGDGRKTKGPLGPTHEAEVSPFYLGKHEVTQKEWIEVYDWALQNGYDFSYDGLQMGSVPVSPGDNYPIVNATWYDMVKWCNARAEKEGLTPVYYTSEFRTEVYRVDNLDLLDTFVDWDAAGYRLPTEAQWEYASRGGLEEKLFPNGDTLDDGLANYDNSVGTLSVVGSYPANGYGLHDMAGNAFEACWDWYYKDWYSNPDAAGKDTHGPKSGIDGFEGTLRIVRGGSYRKALKFSEVSYRGNFNKTWRNYAISFRLALPKLVVGSAHGLSIHVSPLHSGTVSGAGSYSAGVNASIVAKAASGFVFTGWKGDLDDLNAEASIRMDGSKELTATFIPGPSLLDDDADGLTNAEEIGYGRYEVIHSQLTWDNAVSDAEAHGGHLATLVDDAEVKAVLEVLGGTWPIEPVWLAGFSPAGQEWVWTTGETWSYTNWEGNPTAISSKDRYLRVGSTGTWDNIVSDADIVSGYLLEKGYHTDPVKNDSDGDGLTDREEVMFFLTLPNLADTDGDGLTDGVEVHQSGTSPLLTDTDGDGFSDMTEQDAGSIATDPDSTPSAQLSGVITYAGAMGGKVHVDVTGNKQVIDGPLEFSQAGLSTAQFHKMTAFMDVDMDGVQDSWEPRGEYAENPFPISKDLSGVTVLLVDPDNDGDGLTDIYEMGRQRYQVIESSLTWEGAREDAVIRGGHLATINSLAEWEAVMQYASVSFPSAGAKYDLWIGGMIPKGTPDNPWKWITGETWSYQRWMTDEPSATSGQHNSYLYVDSGGAENSFLWKRGTAFNASNRYLLEFGDFTDPAKVDTDEDGLSDGAEINLHKTEPLAADTDSDGLNDGDEINKHETSPLITDTDGDSFDDGVEVAAGTDPTDKASYPAGSLSGTILYDGIPRGTIYITTGSRGTSISEPGDYQLGNLSTATSYELRAFRDVNSNERQDSWEPAGVYVRNPVHMTATVQGIDITLIDPDTDGDGLVDSWEMGYLRYEVIEGEIFTWENARDDAVARGGHLATILSEAEWDAIREAAGPSFPQGNFQYNIWAGGFRPKGNPDNPWQWITGEKWGSTRWKEGEPAPDTGQHDGYLFIESGDAQDFLWWKGNPFNNTNRYLLEFGYFTDPAKIDTDGDGLADGDELNLYNTIPTHLDTDGDGIDDGVEVTLHKTEPTKADTDEDGFSDGDEISSGTDPKDAGSYPAANISGTIAYDGIPRGKIYITTGSRGTSVLEPGNFVLSGVATGKTYNLWAFRDVNGNSRQDNWEPVGAYAENPINLSVNLEGITLILSDPDSDSDGLADSFEMGYLRYEMITGSFSWDDAKADAESRGGHLATIASAVEWTASSEAAGPSFPQGDFVYDFWIGGLRPSGDAAKPWEWITGETWSYNRWLPKEPDAGTGQHEGHLYVESGGVDKSFLWKRGFPFNTSNRYLLEYGYPTDPAKADTDGDGFNDGVEFKARTNSLDSGSHP
jgi:formylglycine-generating enzyme required for sulfatase activity